MKKTKYSSAYDHFLKELEVNYMVYAVFTEAAVNMLRIFSELLRRSTEHTLEKADHQTWVLRIRSSTEVRFPPSS